MASDDIVLNNISGNNGSGASGLLNGSERKSSYDMVKFIAQVLLIYIVVVTSLINLTYYRESDNKLWTVFLSSGLGILVPNPQLKKRFG